MTVITNKRRVGANSLPKEKSLLYSPHIQLAKNNGSEFINSSIFWPVEHYFPQALMNTVV